jgi:hypothetical protein
MESKSPKTEGEALRIRKRYAKDLGQRTGDNPEDIERGVNKLIAESAGSLGHKSPMPPYGAPTWYEKFLDLNRRQKISAIDPEFIRLNVIGGANAYAVLSGLRYLGLISQDGMPTDRLMKLRVIGDDYTKNLREVVEDSYKDLIHKVVLSSAKRESVVSYFMQKHNLGKATSESATRVFVWLANQAGIELSKELTAPALEERSQSKKQSGQGPRRKDKVSTPSQPPEDTEELRVGSVRIWLPKRNRAAAEQAKKLLDLYLEGLE